MIPSSIVCTSWKHNCIDKFLKLQKFTLTIFIFFFTKRKIRVNFDLQASGEKQTEEFFCHLYSAYRFYYFFFNTECSRY